MLEWRSRSTGNRRLFPICREFNCRENAVVEVEDTGIGLAVTMQAVRKMGGRVEVETEKGKGSRSAVRLPLDDGKDSGSEGSRGEDSRPDGEQDRQAGPVLPEPEACFSRVH